MKKLILLLLLLISSAYSKIITIQELKKDSFSLMLGSYGVRDNAVGVANKFLNDDILITTKNNLHMVKMVNISTLEGARTKLLEVKKVYADALLSTNSWMNDLNINPKESKSLKVDLVENSQKTLKIDIVENNQTTPKPTQDFSSIGSILVKKLKADTTSYTAPMPLGTKSVVFKKELFVQGFFNKSTDWFVVVASSDDGISWRVSSVPVWISSSSFESASRAQ